MMAEPAAMGRIHLEATGGSPPIEPTDKDSMQDAEGELFCDTVQGVQRPVGMHIGQARGKPPKPPPG